MEGEADIDPDKPPVDTAAQKEELLAKSVAIMEAFDQEQLYQLSNDIEKFVEIYKQYRNAYFLRIAALTIFCLGMIFLILSFALYYSDNLNAHKVYETCVKENSWSSWKETQNYLQREHCGSIQYAQKECKNTCTFGNETYQSSQPAIEESHNFALCSKEDNSSEIYVRHTI
uniref:Uncharacterized protein n=1 Tax=Panagrolaimus sp. ES5 TaxID=591445 RepID=A0AC34FYI9_9BILA